MVLVLAPLRLMDLCKPWCKQVIECSASPSYGFGISTPMLRDLWSSACRATQLTAGTMSSSPLIQPFNFPHDSVGGLQVFCSPGLAGGICFTDVSRLGDLVSSVDFDQDCIVR